METCWACNGKGVLEDHIICGYCDGYGCFNCCGSGKVPEVTKCEHCNGLEQTK